MDSISETAPTEEQHMAHCICCGNKFYALAWTRTGFRMRDVCPLCDHLEPEFLRFLRLQIAQDNAEFLRFLRLVRS